MTIDARIGHGTRTSSHTFIDAAWTAALNKEAESALNAFSLDFSA
jgi:hypothetical protein